MSYKLQVSQLTDVFNTQASNVTRLCV